MDKPNEPIHTALKQCRSNKQHTLTSSTLCTSVLFQESVWVAERQIPQRRVWLLGTLLRWAIEQLRPNDDAPSWTDECWQPYLFLTEYYFANRTLTQLADQMAISERTARSRQQRGIEQVVNVWQGATNSAENTPIRKQCRHHILQARWDALSEAGQSLTSLLCVYAEPLPLAQLANFWMVAAEGHPKHWGTVLSELREHWIIEPDAMLTMVQIPAAMKTFVQTHLITQGKMTAVRLHLAHYALAQGNGLNAVDYWLAAKQWQLAAEWIWQTHDHLIATGKTGSLQATIKKLVSQLPSAEWRGRLLYVLGILAFHNQALAVAQCYYEQARDTGGPVWATACYQLARVLHKQGLLDEAHHWYESVGNALATSGMEQPLLVGAYLGLALLYTQERPNTARADIYLKRTQPLISQEDLSTWAQWHDLQGIVLGWKGQISQAIPFHLDAYLAATELQAIDLVMRSGRNLGATLTFSGRLKEGMRYIQRTLKIANARGDQQMQGECHKAAGENYFFAKDYATAIYAYQQAYQLFDQLDNKSWLLAVSYDLAEVYACLGDRTAAVFFLQKVRAETIGLTRLQNAMDCLVQKYPIVFATELNLSTRQVRGIRYTQIEGGIRKLEYAQINEVSNKTAQRDLKLLVQKGIFCKEGRRFILCGKTGES